MADELNRTSSMPGELRCGEYAFKLKMNPWQHPIFDETIYHLLALLMALHRACGGVIYLTADDIEHLTQEIFQVFKDRLYVTIGKNLCSFPLQLDIVRVSLLLGTHRSWAALLLKKSHDMPKYLLVENKGIWKGITLEIEISGKVHAKHLPDTQVQNHIETERSLVLSGQGTERSILLPIYGQETMPREQEQETLSTSAIAPVTVHGRSDDTVVPEVDFSSCQRLDWTENTKDWQKYVKIKELKTADIVMSCPTWKPTKPMKITPDNDSLRYLFESEKDIEEILSAVTTKEAGCAVVCRTWRFHVSDGNDTEELPPGHICDILTATDTGRLSFWVVVDILDVDKFLSQMEYLMTTGRMLKYQIVQKGGESGDFSNLWINCHLLPLNTSNSTEKVKMRLSECQEIQSHLCHMYKDLADFELIQRALMKLTLSKESPLKRCIGEHTSITLSAQQAEVLMHKAKVNYVTGPAGSGKSYTATFLYKMYGRERSVYICTTKEFREYLKFNGCAGTLVLGDQDLLGEIKNGTFENKVCVVIDDCHRLACTRKSIKKLFKVLKQNGNMSLFVFADNDYQSFDRGRQHDVRDCIMDLTRGVLKDAPLNFRLTDIYRNTRKVVSFVQAAIQDIHDGHQKIESANMENGEGVECIRMSNLWKHKTDNDLVVYIRSLLLSENYNQSEVAILFESSNTLDEIQQCKQILTEHIPGITVQSAGIFPRTGVIVDYVDTFVGLDANVCVFIISNTEKRSLHPLRGFLQSRKIQCEMNMYNPRYEVFLASRAINKAVFVVPELHEELIQQMKFDHFQVCVGEVNKSRLLR